MSGIQHLVNSDWLFNTQSRVLQADWLMFGNNVGSVVQFHIHVHFQLLSWRLIVPVCPCITRYADSYIYCSEES